MLKFSKKPQNCIFLIACLFFAVALVFPNVSAATDEMPSPSQAEAKKETVKEEPKKEESKKEEVKADEPKKDEPKKDEPKKDEPKKDESKKDESKKDEPKKEEEKAPPKPAAPESIEIKKEPIRITVKLPGTFDVKEPLPIRLKGKEFTAFEIAEAIPHGSTVKKGDVLIRFNEDKYNEVLAEKKRAVFLSELSLREEALAFNAADARFPLLKKDLEVAYELQEEAFKYYFDTEKEMTQKSREMSVKSYEYALESAQEELRQLEKMYEADDIVEETEEFILKRTRFDAERAALTLERVKEQIRRFDDKILSHSEDAMKRDAERDRIGFRVLMETLPFGLEQSKIRLERKKIAHEKELEALKKLEEDKKWLTMKAPQDGIVFYGEYNRGKWMGAPIVDSMLRVGENAKNDTVLFTVLPKRPDQIRVAVPEKELHWIKKGLAGVSTPTARPDDRLAFKVASVQEIPSPSGEYLANLSVIVPENLRLMPGMNTANEIVVYEKDETFLVPASAIKRDSKEIDPNKAHVFLLGEDNKTEKTRVKLGKSDGEKIEILEGVAVGQKILKKAE